MTNIFTLKHQAVLGCNRKCPGNPFCAFFSDLTMDRNPKTTVMGLVHVHNRPGIASFTAYCSDMSTSVLSPGPSAVPVAASSTLLQQAQRGLQSKAGVAGDQMLIPYVLQGTGRSHTTVGTPFARVHHAPILNVPSSYISFKRNLACSMATLTTN